MSRPNLKKIITIGALVLSISLASFSLSACSQQKKLYADEHTLQTEFFSVEIPSDWQIQGGPGAVQSSHNSLSVTLLNPSSKVSVKINVGKANSTADELLKQLQLDLRKEGATYANIVHDGKINYFTYTLNGLEGFAYAASNGNEIACIMVLGDRMKATNLIAHFRDRDVSLFPDFLYTKYRQEEPTNNQNKK